MNAFDVVPIVISHYNNHPDLPTADDEAERVAAILSPWGGDLRPWDVDALERDVGTALARLESWSQPAVSRSSLLLWIGHGSSNEDDVELHVPAGATDVGLEPAKLAKYVADEHRLRDEPDWVIVVVEACGGIRFAEMMESELARRRVRNGVLLIGSGEDRGEGYLGTFRRALEEICAAYWSNDKLISIRDLANRFEDVLQPGFVRAMGLSGRSTLTPRRDLTPTLTTAVDIYPNVRDVLTKLPESTLVQLARKGLGSDLLEIGGRLFGRVAERSAIATWLATHRTGMFVLTGGPGSGKSALLAHLMLHAVPSLRRALEHAPQLIDDWAGGRLLPPVDGALLLTGAATADVVTRLARIAEIELPADRPPSEQVTELVRLLAEREAPLTLFADALDEARDPADIAALLGQLAELTGVRIVLATRPRSGPNGAGLLELLQGPGLGSGLDVTVLALQDDRAAALEFAVAQLRSAGLAAAEEDLGDVLADLSERLAGGADADADAGWDFLHVRLLVTELLATPALFTGAFTAERRRTMALGRSALFRRAMQRLAGAHPQVEPLLLALACAQGRGLPRADRIWATVASVLAPGQTFTEADIDQVLRVAGPYVMLDAEAGRSVFRLAHRTFTEELLARLDRQTRTAVLEALVRLTLEAPDSPPYLRRHLSGHAAALGRHGWSVLEGAPEVLDRLDLATLVADSWRSPAADLPPSVLDVRRTAHLALDGTDGDRCGYRQLGAARAAGHYLPTIEPVAGAAWQVAAAQIVRDPSYQTDLPSPPIPVNSLAVCAAADGTVVVAYGNDHGQIRLWNPWQGSTTDVTTGTGGEILGLATLSGSHGTSLASVGTRQPTRLWPLDGEGEASELRGRDGGTRCAVEACPTADGTSLLAIGTTSGRLRLVNPDRATGQQPMPLTGHAARITGLAMFDAGGERELVSVSVDGSLRRWSLPHGRRRKKEIWSTPLWSVAVIERAGLILTGDALGVVTVWNHADLDVVESFAAHDGPVRALALLSDDAGRIIVASGGADRRVRLWDGATWASVGPDLTGHDDVVTDLVALRSPDGAPLVASGSRDGQVKIWTTVVVAQPASARQPGSANHRESPARWDLTTSDGRAVTLMRAPSGLLRCRLETNTATDLPLKADKLRCAAVITGESAVTIATSSSNDIHTWRADTGEAAGPPLRQHRDWVRALLTLQLDEGHAVLVSGGDDGLICLWDPWSGGIRHQLHLGGAIRGLTPAENLRRFVVVLDGGTIEIEMEDDVLYGSKGGNPRGQSGQPAT
ncbi:AAA family ATPase [Jiangella sp. DSM 45060]|uniref:AAA family ATPase n=1 Tax=Jiangella sp. DSM 45060 TaxID=1798224 RepID=UPI0015618ACD|nr:AAA family ATPase [Jiangella sp. DSM 45060]